MTKKTKLAKMAF